MVTSFEQIAGSEPSVWAIQTAGPGPQGRLPLTAEMLRESPSGDIFGLSQNAGMGWDPSELGRPQYLMFAKTYATLLSCEKAPVVATFGSDRTISATAFCRCAIDS